jgi:hypothetical protein
MTDRNQEDRDELLAAVQTLISEVKELNDKMALYAPREEVRKTFRTGAWRFLAGAVAIILISQMITTTMISYCFLNATGERRAACTFIPGYGQAVEQNDIRLNRFALLLDGLEQTTQKAKVNDARLDQLESRLAELEKGAK